jgi:hypothetical protein
MVEASTTRTTMQADTVTRQPKKKGQSKAEKQARIAQEPKAYTPAGNAPGRLVFLGHGRHYDGPALFFNWDITSGPGVPGNASHAESRKELFDDSQYVKPGKSAKFESIIKSYLVQYKVTLAKLPDEAKGSLEYCLSLSQAELQSYYTDPAFADSTPPPPQLSTVPSAIEVLSSRMEQHRRLTTPLLDEVQRALVVSPVGDWRGFVVDWIVL